MSLLRKLLAPLATPDREDSRGRATAQSDRRIGDAAPPGVPLDRALIVGEAAALAAAGRYGESLDLIETARTAAPDDPELIFARASTLFAAGRLHEARDAAARAEALGLRRVDLYLQLGWSCYGIGHLDEAEAWMRKAVAAKPEGWEPYLNLAVVLAAQKRPADAAASYERVLALRPDDFDCLIGLANCRQAQGDLVAAERLLRRAIAVNEETPVGWDHLAVLLGRQDRNQDAREALARAAELEATSGVDVGSFVNLTVNLRDAGRTRDALDLLEANLAQRPSAHAYLGYAHLLLSAGRLREGWSYYEFRLLQYPLLQLRPKFDRPMWAGQDLRGKTILLREEQGLGDTIQFLRYAKWVKALGATVLLRTTVPMKNLARGFPGVDHVLGPNEPNLDFDYYIHLLSLPRVFGTDRATIPSDIPYLQAEPERVERWAPNLGRSEALRIGLAWAGSPLHPSDRYRSIPLDSLATLADCDGVRFFSLQKGPAAELLESSPPNFEIVNLGPELEDFCDTAAVVAQLDLVICVDTAVAHLAGALGKPVWVMLAQPPDFRWLEEGDDSAWYPTMRLFRQRRRGDWADVMQQVKAALRQWAKGETTGIAPYVHRGMPAPMPHVEPGTPFGHRPGFSAVAEARVGILQYLPDDAVVGSSLGWYGEYLQPQLDLLVRIVRPGARVMEVGAGIGAHTLPLAVAAGSAGHVYLYESRPVVRRILQQNLEANDVTNVTLMRRMLGAPAESRVASGSESSIVAVSTPPPAMTQVTETLDELLLERLDWLKVNAGVAALDMLEGAGNALWRLRPWLFLAAPDESALTALASRAKEFSYRCWRIETPLFNPKNFNRRDNDIFDGQSALALLAFPEEIEVDIPLDGCVEL